MRTPSTDEYSPYYQQYIDQLKGQEPIEALQAQQNVAIAFYSTIPKNLWDYRYAAGKWTIKEVLGHIVDTERIFGYRALCFARNDQASLPGFEQDDYIVHGNFQERSPESLILEYSDLRRSTISLASSFSEEASQRRGLANNNRISVRALIACCAGHELHHIQVLKDKYLGKE